MRSRIIIADEQRLFAAGMERLLAAECDVVCVVYDRQTLFDRVRAPGADVVVLGQSSFDTVSVIDDLRQLDAEIGIVVVTSDDPQSADEALRCGAAAYVPGGSSVSELLYAVRIAHRRAFDSGPMAGRIVRLPAKSRGDAPELTARQREVLRLLAQGKSMKEAANALHLTARTVAFHKYRMMRMLKIKNSAELVRFALAKRIL